MSDAADSAKALLDVLNGELEQRGIEERVEFEPVDTVEADLEAAAAFAGRALPGSYAQFVRRYGVFTINGELTGMGWGNNTRLLSPSEAVAVTQGYREELAQFDDEVSSEILDDALLFCADPVDEFFHLFVLSSADDRGEMGVRTFDYQDPAMNDDWHEGDTDFVGTVTEIAQRVRDHLSRSS